MEKGSQAAWGNVVKRNGPGQDPGCSLSGSSGSGSLTGCGHRKALQGRIGFRLVHGIAGRTQLLVGHRVKAA